ncbi:MAG: hypothetical protein DMF87_16100 [Acidobacteria bacterium]|nr:MAG: hypothetical protein DMF88_13980 [Acidobacteriota bacterium]PYR77439.1 MAG: hypothetical protein DMF87_16100 [Acidobacteriota bacterium]
MLLLIRALLAELTDDFFPKPRRFGKDFIQPVEHLFQIFCADWGSVGHSFRKDYGMRVAA